MKKSKRSLFAKRLPAWGSAKTFVSLGRRPVHAVIASVAKQSILLHTFRAKMDCFVAARLAMTGEGESIR
jgi:hypothetical protein